MIDKLLIRDTSGQCDGNGKRKGQNMREVADLFLPHDSRQKTIPIFLAREKKINEDLAGLTKAQMAWLKATGFTGKAGRHALLPGTGGALSGVVLGMGKSFAAHDDQSAARLVGCLPARLPENRYHLASGTDGSADVSGGRQGFDAELAALAWGLGAYRFEQYRSGKKQPARSLKLPEGVDHQAVVDAVEAIWLGRDLINTPSNDLGPDELESAARKLAKRHGAKISCITGDDLLAKNFPLIHAVGRASTRAPRLIDLSWGKPRAPSVTLIGKGICFDTGGLDIKPASGMLLMKKDMGGAAAVLALAHMIMAADLPLRLRVLIPAAENSIAGNAFRPGDIITSRSGLSVEIGNTDAEGRLVLADALALADEEKPDYLMTFATLTGAARVALGPDLPPFYVDDDDLADALAKSGTKVCDPLWRMPFWAAYDAMLDSPSADMNNISFGGFAGSITAALFLRRFVRNSHRYAHFDIYGWQPSNTAMTPKGGHPQAVRAVFAALQDITKA